MMYYADKYGFEIFMLVLCFIIFPYVAYVYLLLATMLYSFRLHRSHERCFLIALVFTIIGFIINPIIGVMTLFMMWQVHNHVVHIRPIIGFLKRGK